MASSVYSNNTSNKKQSAYTNRYKKGSSEANNIINWNKSRGYTKNYIKSFQRKVNTEDDGYIGINTINAIYNYQSRNGLLKDGKWGNECATNANLPRQYVKYNNTNNNVNKNNNNNVNKASNKNELKHQVKTGDVWNTNIKNSDVDGTGIPTQKEVRTGKSKYGKPMTSDCQQPLKLPYSMYASYGKDGLGGGSKVNTIYCHKLIHNRLKSIFEETLATYGEENIHKYRLDVYSGAYVPKKTGQSGGKSGVGSDYSKLSMHAWGVAIDIDGGNNPNRTDTKNVDWLNMNSSKGKEHNIKLFWDIVAKYGGYSLGKNSNKDWMHIQFAQIS